MNANHTPAIMGGVACCGVALLFLLGYILGDLNQSRDNDVLLANKKRLLDSLMERYRKCREEMYNGRNISRRRADLIAKHSENRDMLVHENDMWRGNLEEAQNKYQSCVDELDKQRETHRQQELTFSVSQPLERLQVEVNLLNATVNRKDISLQTFKQTQRGRIRALRLENEKLRAQLKQEQAAKAASKKAAEKAEKEEKEKLRKKEEEEKKAEEDELVTKQKKKKLKEEKEASKGEEAASESKEKEEEKKKDREEEEVKVITKEELVDELSAMPLSSVLQKYPVFRKIATLEVRKQLEEKWGKPDFKPTIAKMYDQGFFKLPKKKESDDIVSLMTKGLKSERS